MPPMCPLCVQVQCHRVSQLLVRLTIKQVSVSADIKPHYIEPMAGANRAAGKAV